MMRLLQDQLGLTALRGMPLASSKRHVDHPKPRPTSQEKAPNLKDMYLSTSILKSLASFTWDPGQTDA